MVVRKCVVWGQRVDFGGRRIVKKYTRLGKVAPPPETVTMAVPCNGPVRVGSEAVTCAVLSPVSGLPKGSSSYIAGWMAKACPAVAVAEGCVWMTTWLAAAGLTVM